MHSKQGCYLHSKITTCIAIKTKSLAQKKQRLAEGKRISWLRQMTAILENLILFLTLAKFCEECNLIQAF